MRFKQAAMDSLQEVMSETVRYDQKNGISLHVCASFKSKTVFADSGEPNMQVQQPTFLIRRCDLPRPPQMGDRITRDNKTYELRQPPHDSGQVAWEIAVSATDIRR